MNILPVECKCINAEIRLNSLQTCLLETLLNVFVPKKVGFDAQSKPMILWYSYTVDPEELLKLGGRELLEATQIHARRPVMPILAADRLHHRVVRLQIAQ